MNRKKFIPRILIALLVTLLSAACNSPAPLPSSTPISTPSAIPTTDTPTPVPPTETPTLIPFTATFTPSPTATPTITPPIGEVGGGAIIGLRDGVAIVYGLREGAASEDIYVFDTQNNREVDSLSLILASLSGEPFAMTVYEDQPFSTGEGKEVPVDFIAGWPMDTVATDQSVAVTVGRTVNINSSFPIDPVDLSGLSLTPPGGGAVKIQGWLELYAIQQIDTRLDPSQDQGSFNTLLLHSGEKIYLLGFLPGYRYKLYPGDLLDDVIHLNMGPNYEYLLWGFPGKAVSLWLQDQGVVFQLAYIESVFIPSLDGLQIVFVSDREGRDLVCTLEGGATQPQCFTQDVNVPPRNPVWSPDRTKIAFYSAGENSSDLELFVMNADGTGLFNLTNNSTLDGVPDWSPDGKKLAYTCSDGQLDQREVCVIMLDGTGKTALTHNSTADGEPHWSPDGARIAFYSMRYGNHEVYAMNADGSQQVRLTNSDATDWPSSWSPDGTKILFNTDRDGNYEVYMMNLDGTNLINLTNNPGDDYGGTFSDDGRLIIFGSNRDGTEQIYVMKPDGTGQTRLMRTTFNDKNPDW